MAQEKSTDLRDVQCDVCGCYCFGSEPHPWKKVQTPNGEVEMCTSCTKMYDGKNVEDPAYDYKLRLLSAELIEAENHLGEVEDALAKL